MKISIVTGKANIGLQAVFFRLVETLTIDNGRMYLPYCLEKEKSARKKSVLGIVTPIDWSLSF